MNRTTSTSRTKAVAHTLSAGRAASLIAAATLLIGLWNLEGPEFWWDEGWTLSVARNVVERGHYGRLLDGQPAPGGLEASPVVTLPVALSFRVFGVGLWQERLVSLAGAAAALALMFVLAARLYDRRVAWGALGVLMALTAHPQLNALLTGRQALGEMPMLLFLMGGYLGLDTAVRGRALWIAPAALLWSLALLAKAQTLPFWVVSMAGATGVALLMHRWRAAALVAGGALLAYLARPWVLQIVMLPVAGRTLPGTPVSGIYEVTAFVPNLLNRLFALQMILIGGIPTLIGLGYAAWRLLKDARATNEPLAVSPSYLVVGRFAAGNHLYDAALASGAFREVIRDGRYTVYERIRE